MNSKNSRKKGVLLVHNLITSESVLIPTSIFRDRRLSVFEAVVKYLKEERQLNYHQISQILGRDERNIWTIYDRLRKKNLALDREKPEAIEISDELVPAAIFLDRTVAVLEALVVHLKDVSRLNYHEIGMILGRNERTIWTAYARAKEKLRRRNGTR